jgi:undecaprenyl diphosphate synthase
MASLIDTAPASDTAVDLLSGPIPEHIGIIMDENGRWAASRGFPRFEGHRRGLEAVRRTVRAASDLGVRYLTIYSFSSENWRRPATEVSQLLGLLRGFIRSDVAALARLNMRIKRIGSRVGLSQDICDLFDEAEASTADNTGMMLLVAFNYGSRDEIVRAAADIARDVAEGRLALDAIDESAVARRLDTADIPDPDLVIRTSGELRLSNFLMWQAAYAELLFVPVLWPEFDRAHLEAAIAEYQRRDRRFGGLKSAAGTPR